ncbi:serine hydrolase domain-containing protein [Clostridium tagluense]|uniref:serine hydrolase domain-containing protein n=1 Tax=Clostridium tagluense TaxID=360422 RepID=UPI001C6F5621|nr:serine hydrolase domain-containing protein [Clostridium tagluense]MBW9156947.1 beta-lactamase family protein [Clostridium tagluense]WLC66417.1 beta-lactamase family protein [Clostridium tagluense]
MKNTIKNNINKMNKVLCFVLTLIFFLTICPKNIALAETRDISLESFQKMSDQYMKKVLEEYKVAGATVSVVKDGKIFFEKGYGYSDVAKKTVVNADTTVFQIASITKLFTATAVMKLVEEGKISLDEDVNNYLKDFKIKNNFSKPITVRNLLNHTSGFDEKWPMVYRTTGDKFYDSIESLGDFLKKDLPPVINTPGTITQYNVYNYAILGYLIEKVSEKPVNEYITDEILKPLNMKNSSYWINKDILGSMSKPYKYEKDKYIETSYSMPIDHPSGAMCSTASDMANFMLMQLNSGEFNKTKFLNEKSVKAMQTSNYYNDPNLLGFGLGFFQNQRNGYVALEHNGELPSFYSWLTLMPEKNIGMFISINTDSSSSSKVCNEYTDKFYEFFNVKKESTKNIVKVKDSTSLSMDSEKIKGTYTTTKYPHKGIFKVMSVIPSLNVKIEYEKSTGNMILYVGDKKSILKHIDKDLFYDEEVNQYIKLVEQNNKIYILAGVQSYEKIPEINKYLSYMLPIGLVLAFLGCIMLVVSLIRKKDKTKSGKCSKILLLSMCFFTCMYGVLNVILFIYGETNNMNVINNVITPFIRVNSYLAVTSTLLCALRMYYAWKNNNFSKFKKIFYSIVIIFAGAVVMFMFKMNGFY